MDKTFIEKLTEAKAIKEQSQKDKGGYGMKDTPHLVEVLEYLKQYRTEKGRGQEQTVYNSELEEYITEKENIPQELKSILGTQVFFAQGDFRDNLKAEHKAKMLSEGWSELTRDVEYRGKIWLNAVCHGSWATSHINDTAKLITDGRGDMFIIAKGKRSRGWSFSSLEQAFYKPLAI
jgi:hypothetical protein